MPCPRRQQVCSAVVLDVAQAFDKAWHEGLIHKMNKIPPKQYVAILTSYISNKLFRIIQEEEYSDIKKIKASVSQGSVLGPILYLLYTNNLPTLQDITVVIFAENTAP